MPGQQGSFTSAMIEFKLIISITMSVKVHNASAQLIYPPLIKENTAFDLFCSVHSLKMLVSRQMTAE
jgi:hypothetical protein